MSNPRLQDIQTAVRLLTDLSRSTFQGRYADCEAIIAQHLKDGSAFLLELIKAAVEAGVHQVTLIEDAVSFLDDADLARLAFFLQSAASRGTDVEDLLSHALLQAPDLFPDAALATSYDFADWQQHTDLRSAPACKHFIFEGGSPSDSPFPTHRNHPTWHLPTTGGPLAVGGRGSAACPVCRQKLTHLVTLDSSEEKFVPGLSIETCANSLEPTYYSHDAEGRPTPIGPFHSDDGSAIKPASLVSTVRVAATPPRWLRQSYGISNSRQNLFRLGGLPSWVQGPQFPLVPGTDREMKFLLQFDSLAGFFWGSGGMLYVFWDEESRITCHVSQWT
ncbi:hypothetical protein [Mesorhizobium sp. M4B.F.Ca.ET.143.01.1.1]|uniref:hypothetical protein n=2 Tax=unclassified Mesorhizobium TaxID=325217 RepID=UPI001093B73C|nr:hypothetical protein [Mesorhizobium sp. M4B.F.Ca.ET.143.01.1.1]TGV24583.1 hypothetical protein EN786_18640 [Mesorhizobium sp. M4B.F.Ca.ET.143.01.1.1]